MKLRTYSNSRWRDNIITMDYSQSGNYLALAGLVVMILGRFGVIVATNDIVTVFAAIVTIYGIIRQFMAHKTLAIQAGALTK